MKLSEFVEHGGRGTMAVLSRESGISYPTIYKAVRGVAVTWVTAKAISEATKGQVTVESLCEGSRDAA